MQEKPFRVYGHETDEETKQAMLAGAGMLVCLLFIAAIVAAAHLGLLESAPL